MTCQDCKYFYEGKISENKRVYSALHDQDILTEVKKSVYLCGFYPQSTEIDLERIPCNYFTPKEPVNGEPHVKLATFKYSNDYELIVSVNEFLERNTEIISFIVDNEKIYIFYEE